MSQSRIEVLKISIPTAPPGLPPKVGERLTQLGPGGAFTRGEARAVVGSETATNMFLAKGVDDGFLVPIGWNRYRVPPADVLQALGRVANPLHRRLISWARIVPEETDREVCFAGPRLWRDTDLSIDELLPVVALRSQDRRVEGLPPQWDAFYQDLQDPPERWRLTAASETLAEFKVPSAADAGLLLVASLDPRWRQAYHQLGASAKEVALRVAKLGQPREAPRGGRAAAVGVGPPHRLRLLAPRWYLDTILGATRESLLHRSLEEGAL